MRRILLPVLLLTTATLSLSDVLPIITVNEADTDPTIDDQIYDNTIKNIRDNNPNIFYEFLIGSSKNDKTSKVQRSAKRINKKENSDLLHNEDSYDDEGYRKKQWHNYPRQLDRLHNNQHSSPRIKKSDFVLEDTKTFKRVDDAVDDIYRYDEEKIDDDNDIDAVAVPLLILKIRLAFLNNDLQDINSNNNEYTDLIPVVQANAKYHRKDDSTLYTNKIDTPVNGDSERQKRYRIKDKNLDRGFNENKTVNKRIFSLWSRLQSLSHKGHELQHRRHLYAFYGLPEDGSGTLTAETRATLIRPPGSPLRWG